jgi:hypothetical protein
MIQSIVIIALIVICAGSVIGLWVSRARRGDLQEILNLIGEALLLATGGGRGR